MRRLVLSVRAIPLYPIFPGAMRVPLRDEYLPDTCFAFLRSYEQCRPLLPLHPQGHAQGLSPVRPAFCDAIGNTTTSPLPKRCSTDVKFSRHDLKNSVPSFFSTLLFLFVVSVITMSYAMIVFERPVGPDTNLDLFENSVWLIIITMTTVGYGDTYPKTPSGRYVAIIAALLAGEPYGTPSLHECACKHHKQVCTCTNLALALGSSFANKCAHSFRTLQSFSLPWLSAL